MLLSLIFGADTLKSDTADTLVRKDKFIKSPTKAALRSAVLPGWGQFYNGAYLKGVFLGALTFASTAYTAYRYYLMKRDGGYSYNLTTDFLGAVIINVAIWGYTVADAFTDAYLYGFKEYRDTLKTDLDTSPQKPADEKGEEGEDAGGD